MMAAEVLAVTLLLLLASSCRISYKLNGAALDYTVYKTVRIDNFPIRAALVYPPLQQTFENKLLDYVQRNTRLQTTDGNSDLVMEGEITGYSLSPQAVNEDAYASKVKNTGFDGSGTNSGSGNVFRAELKEEREWKRYRPDILGISRF